MGFVGVYGVYRVHRVHRAYRVYWVYRIMGFAVLIGFGFTKGRAVCGVSIREFLQD